MLRRLQTGYSPIIWQNLQVTDGKLCVLTVYILTAVILSVNSSSYTVIYHFLCGSRCLICLKIILQLAFLTPSPARFPVIIVGLNMTILQNNSLIKQKLEFPTYKFSSSGRDLLTLWWISSPDVLSNWYIQINNSQARLLTPAWQTKMVVLRLTSLSVSWRMVMVQVL